jgi:hypothetical protein
MHRYIVPLLLASGFTTCLAQSDQRPLEESPGAANGLGYSSVSEALESLKAKAGVTVKVTKPDGWVIVNESSPVFAVWSFTPEGHYAHPAVVRRVIQQRPGGDVYVEMTALCQADKASCDKLIREFQQLNERMREQVRARLQQGKGQQ